MDSRENLLDVLNHAGLKTIWLDNHSGCKDCSEEQIGKSYDNTILYTDYFPGG